MIKRKNLSQIKCIVVQVDGVLTDGKTWFNQQGHKQRRFSVRDSMAIRRLIKAGYGFAVVYKSDSAEDDKEIAAHFEPLGVKHFVKIAEPKTDFSQFFSAFEASAEECAFIGVSSFGTKNKFGIEVTTANAPHEVRTSVEYITGSEGGEGALAEFSQLVLDHGRQSDEAIL